MMKKILLLIALLATVQTTFAQRFSFEELEQALNASLDKTYEELFLNGFALVDQKTDPEKEGKVFTFSNRRKTLATAKLITKGEFAKAPLESFVQYVTYDYSEFKELRKLMIDLKFDRKDRDNISEDSDYQKDHLEVKFRTDLVKGNRTFLITLRNTSAPSLRKANPLKKLREAFKSKES